MIQLVNLKQSQPSGSLSFEVNSEWAGLVWLGLGFLLVDYLVWGFFFSVWGFGGFSFGFF